MIIRHDFLFQFPQNITNFVRKWLCFHCIGMQWVLGEYTGCYANKITKYIKLFFKRETKQNKQTEQNKIKQQQKICT